MQECIELRRECLVKVRIESGGVPNEGLPRSSPPARLGILPRYGGCRIVVVWIKFQKSAAGTDREIWIGRESIRSDWQQSRTDFGVNRRSHVSRPVFISEVRKVLAADHVNRATAYLGALTDAICGKEAVAKPPEFLKVRLYKLWV